MLYAFLKELQQLRNDRWLFAIAIVAPLILAAFLWGIFSSGLPRELPVAVLDADRSQASRLFIRQMDASPALTVSRVVTSPSEGIQYLRTGDVYAFVHIPSNLEREMARSRQPEVTVFFNAQYLLVAKLLKSSLYAVGTYYAVEMKVARNLPELPVIDAAKARSLPVRAQITPLYNSNLNYAQFLLPGILYALLQVFACSVAVIVVGRGFKYPRQDQWQNQHVAGQLAGRLLPYGVIYSIYGAIALLLFYGPLGWPMQASPWALLPLVALFVVASQLIGVVFYCLTFHLERALSLAGAFCAPAFAFLGITFPVSDMSRFAAFWRELMPAAHLLDGYVQQTQYASGLSGLVLPATVMCVYLFAWPWVTYRLNRHIEQNVPHVSATA